MLKNIYEYKELVWVLTLKELKLKYRGSFLGFFWTLLDPLFMILVLLLVFTKLFSYNIPNYPSYLLLGIFVWNYFQETTIKSLHIFREYKDIITKTYVPKEVLVIITSLVALIDFLLKFLVLIISLFVLKVLLNWPSLIHININFLLLIIIIGLQFLFILGFTFILSSVHIYFKDIANIWGVLAHIGFFITPIFYPQNLIPSKYYIMFTINPMYHFVEAYRSVILPGTQPVFYNFLMITLFTAIFLFSGQLIFKIIKKGIAEHV